MSKKKKPTPRGQRGEGRKTVWRSELCQMLVDHMSMGLSFDSFPAVCGISRSTLYNFLDSRKEFREAYDLAISKCRLFYEKLGIAIMTGRVEGGNPAIWIYNMKCRFPDEWEGMSPLHKKQKLIESKKENDDVKVIISLPSNGRENQDLIDSSPDPVLNKKEDEDA